MCNKKAIKVTYPKFNVDIDNPYQEEMEKLLDISITKAGTTRTRKNIIECLTKSLRSKYGITDKEELKDTVNKFMDLHGLGEENFDPLAVISKLTFGDLQTVNDVSVDPNANKTSTNAEGICAEAMLPFKKLVGYDYLYQTLKELYGKSEAKKCCASMYDLSLFLHDATNILKPYCYCIDASKIVTEGRNFGTVHSGPAHRIATYITTLGDTIREISFNIAGACAIGTFFEDIANLAIYRERITLDDLRTDKKIRKAISNHFQQFIYTVLHNSRNAVESPFTNVSLFDREKLRNLLSDENYGWYFPKKAAVVEDNGLENTKEAFKEFVLDYIEELQELFIDMFDAGDPLRNGLQFPFPVTTLNFSTMRDENGNRKLMLQGPDNALLEYVSHKDICKYNIFASASTKVASCCRLLSDSEMLKLGSGVNSFGGSQVSLGSHRVVTIDFFRCACEAKSYDDFKKIITDRVEEMTKILKAHRVLIHKLEKCGTQPWITNGWIKMSHLFSTYGCAGYVEADEMLKFKFNHKDFDYMKDFLIYFNEECKRIGEREKMIWNIEAVPFEGGAPKAAKANKYIFADEDGFYTTEDNRRYEMPKILANQWCSLWKDYTLVEKMKRDGEINSLMTGGSIVHNNVDGNLTPSQVKTLINKAVEYGSEHFALNATYIECKECGHVHKGKFDKCPDCGSEKLDYYSRIIGYFSRISGWSKDRREYDWPNRKFTSQESINEQLKN